MLFKAAKQLAASRAVGWRKTAPPCFLQGMNCLLHMAAWHPARCTELLNTLTQSLFPTQHPQSLVWLEKAGASGSMPQHTQKLLSTPGHRAPGRQ